MPPAISDEIALFAIGDVGWRILTHLHTAIGEVFRRRCRIVSAMPRPVNAYDTRRTQYAAEAILAQIDVGQSGRALGIADLDLFVPQLNFVFGLADPYRRRAVIALPRLRESFYGVPDDEPLFLARAVKEAAHELGHTYGLSHCHDRRCVMAFSNSLRDTDYKQPKFCAMCVEQLRS